MRSGEAEGEKELKGGGGGGRDVVGKKLILIDKGENAFLYFKSRLNRVTT